MISSRISLNNETHTSRMGNRKDSNSRSTEILNLAKIHVHMSRCPWRRRQSDDGFRFTRLRSNYTSSWPVCYSVQRDRDLVHSTERTFLLLGFEHETRTLTETKTWKMEKNMKALDWLYESPTIYNTQHGA